MKYKKELTISKMLYIFKKNILVLFGFTILFCALSFVYSGIKHQYTNPYKSNAIIVSNQNLTNRSMGTMSKLVTSTMVCDEVATKLTNQDFKLSTGKEIKSSFIQSNLGSSFSVNTNRITVSFKSSDKNIVEPILNIVLETTLEQSAKFDTLKNNFEIASRASTPSQTFNTNILKNALMFSAAGLLIGLFLILIKSYYDDKICYSYELEKNNLKTYEIAGYRATNKNKKTSFVESINLISNNMLLSNNSCFLFTTTNSSTKVLCNVVNSIYEKMICQSNVSIFYLDPFSSKELTNSTPIQNSKDLQQIQSIIDLKNKTLVLLDNPVNNDDSFTLLPLSNQIFIIIKACQTKKRDLFSLINSLDEKFEIKCIFIK